jgi:hypothetical protein
VLAAIVAFIMIDPRVRFPENLTALNIPVLAVIPHVRTPFSKRVVRMDIVMCLFLGALIMAAYVGLAFASKMGLV